MVFSTYLAQLFVVMTTCEEKIENLLMPHDRGPGKRCVAGTCRICIAHVCALDETLGEKEIAL